MTNPRLDGIRRLISEKPFVSQQELEALFPDVSPMTVRRDTILLEKQNELLRVRGGVRGIKFIASSVEDNFFARSLEYVDEKVGIAKTAMNFVVDGRAIFIDAGSTACEFAKLFSGRRVSIVTTSPSVAVELSRVQGPAVTLVGGMLNRENLSIAGTQAIDFLRSVNLDVAFLSTSGYSPDSGFTCGNYYDCEIKKFIISKVRQVVMMMDCSKIDKVLPYTFCKPEDINILITDRSLPADVQKVMKACRVQTVCSAV
ncbi:MAG: DeoR/GlpR transcriptional regulator [Clostridia bacterium]|nr:DeoR/GlpR transcriptional regulator [Clostridia bacterium]